MDTHFNINRFLLVLKRDLFENAQTALFGILTVLSILSFILLMTSFDIDNISINNINSKLYFITFWITGVFISGMAFKDLRNKEKTMSYLMLPASSLEKFLSILLLTTVGFFVSFTILFGAFNLINITIIQSISDTLNLKFYNPINSDVWMSIGIFIPIQSIFLTGATTFKRVPLFYTILYFFLFLLIYGFLATILLKFYSGNVGISEFGDNGTFRFYASDDTWGEKPIADILSVQTALFFFSYLLAPIFWMVSWFKLKEKEV